MIDNEEIIKDFLIESAENLDQLDKDFVEMEKNPQDDEILSRIFRAIHTIKGTCGFFGFSKLEKVAHGGESLLSKMRDGELHLTPEITSALLRVVDAVREILGNIEQNGAEGNTDYSELVALLEKLQGDREIVANASMDTEDPDEYLAMMAARQPQGKKSSAVASQISPPGDEEPVRLGQLLVGVGWAEKSAVEKALQIQQSGDTRPVGEIMSDAGQVSSQRVADALEIQREVAHTKSVSESTIRVDVHLLDRLMNMVGELVLSRNQTLKFINLIEDSGLQSAAQRLNLITSELQEAVMKTRMQPISGVWGRLPRVVRDISVSLDKKIRLEMEGQETELDRTILEAIKDPLTHIVRNSVDHGIESPEKRRAAGKPEEGLLLLRAYHEGGQVIIEISDDGAGVNTQRVAEKAVERNLMSRDELSRMSEREITNLVFLPGFSTAEKVTNISGRGVGMDVVKTNIEKIGGAIDLSSDRGKGSTLKIKIPLTLAIIPALIVTCRDGRYAIPQVSLLELVRLDGEAARKGIEMVNGSPVYRLRGNLLPLVYLDRLLKSEEGQPGAPEAEQVLNIVVLQAEDRPFGLIVDGIHDTEEIVVKPLVKQLQHIGVFAGAAVMGDGKISLILDVVGIAHAAHVLSEERSGGRVDAGPSRDQKDENVQALLLLQAGKEGRFAMPLSMVARLEEFETTSIERAGNIDVVQYRGQILPLLYVGDCFGGHHAETDNTLVGNLQVVVYARDGESVGLVVNRILDITEERITTKSHASRAGVLQTAVIQDRVTELLDIESLISMSLPDYAASSSNGFEG
jgi:two-component system chemotaxis sensor kinase CheA